MFCPLKYQRFICKSTFNNSGRKHSNLRDTDTHESDVNEGIYIYLTNFHSLFYTLIITELYIMPLITVSLKYQAHNTDKT